MASCALVGCDEYWEDGPPRTAADLHAQVPEVYVTTGPVTDLGETFPEAFAASEATRPRPERPRSISLGYVGDAPLTGGVMRDTAVVDTGRPFIGASPRGR